MFNQALKDQIVREVLPFVQTPAQYLGSELNIVRKDHRQLRGKLCLGFPDAYTIGMSHHGLQVLYTLMNDQDDWACERVYTPWTDMEEELRKHQLPLYSLETFTPLCEFDVVGFTLQYEICYANILTMLDLGKIPLHATERTMQDPLIIAGGPCAQNPEPIADFIDLFVTGDGEPSLPLICDLWMDLKEQAESDPNWQQLSGNEQRQELLLKMAKQLPFAYVPSLYEAEYDEQGHYVTIHPKEPDLAVTVEPSVISDLESIPLPTAPLVPMVQCVHDRIAIEIMRGCPWQCRFCQSTVIKRPLRIREVDTIVENALEAYEKTGFRDISLLSLSSSDYPHFEQLIKRLQEVFRPLGVNINLPSLRVNEQLKSVAELMSGEKKSGLTLAPEVARDDMREQIRKKIKNEDLYDGCRMAFRNGWRRVKLYFMCGLPGERAVDLDGIVDMAETISKIGKEEMGRYAQVTAAVSNFVPKPHTPYQWNAIQKPEYFQWAHHYMKQRCSLRAVKIKCHDVGTTLLEGVLTRADRRMGKVIETAWRKGARLDGWHEMMNHELWWDALKEVGIDTDDLLYRQRELMERLPWDHLNVKKGRTYLEKEQNRSVVQLAAMADAS